MRFTSKYNICKCFACGACYDIFDIVGIDYGLDNFKDKINKVKEIYEGYVPVKIKEIKTNDDKIYDYTNYYKKCIKNIYKSNYLQSRGISENLIKKYNIGYDEERNLIVFPINKNCYFARSTISKDKIKSKGKSDIWNKEVLKDSDENTLVYVTEGIIDSLSLETVDPNIKTISINGVGNINQLLNEIKNINYKGTIIITFDKDNAGISASNILKEELAKLNVNSFSVSSSLLSITEDCKDLNEMLINHCEILKSNYSLVDKCLENIKGGGDCYQLWW